MHLDSRSVPVGPLAVALAIFAAGCLPERPAGHFGPDAFYHVQDHYRVRYADGELRRLLPPSWEIESFELDEQGLPSSARQGTDHVQRYDLSRYTHSRRPRVVTMARYDLRYLHEAGQGEIWVRSLPLRDEWATDTLPVLMRRTIATLAAAPGAGPDLLGRTAMDPSRVRVVSEGEARVDGRFAFHVTFDLLLDGSEGSGEVERVTVVGVRPVTQRLRVGRTRLPMLVVFGVASTPQRHAEHLRDFEELVRRVDFSPRG